MKGHEKCIWAPIYFFPTVQFFIKFSKKKKKVNVILKEKKCNKTLNLEAKAIAKINQTKTNKHTQKQK